MKNCQKEGGYILIAFSCLISFALIIFTGGYLSFQGNQARQLSREISSLKAFYIAQAGLYKMAQLNTTDPLEEDFGGGSYKVEYNGGSTYISVGRFNNVERTLSADIGEETPSIFEAAMYVQIEPVLCRLQGKIDGGSYYSIQSPSIINDTLFRMNEIYIDPNMIDSPTKRGDNTTITTYLKDEEAKWKYLASDPNINNPGDGCRNAKIIYPTGHNATSKTETVYQYVNGKKTSIKIATYSYNKMDQKLVSAHLTIYENKLLELPSGTYYLNTLTVGNNAKLKGNGPITIFCTEDVLIKSGAEIGLEADPSQFALKCYATGYSKPREIELLDCSEFYGTITALDKNEPGFWRLIFHRGCKLKGAVVVGFFQLYTQNSPECSNYDPWLIEFYEPLAMQSPTPTSWYEWQNE